MWPGRNDPSYITEGDISCVQRCKDSSFVSNISSYDSNQINWSIYFKYASPDFIIHGNIIQSNQECDFKPQ